MFKKIWVDTDKITIEEFINELSQYPPDCEIYLGYTVMVGSSSAYYESPISKATLVEKIGTQKPKLVLSA